VQKEVRLVDKTATSLAEQKVGKREMMKVENSADQKDMLD
jgi:hypothetical protein